MCDKCESDPAYRARVDQCLAQYHENVVTDCTIVQDNCPDIAKFRLGRGVPTLAHLTLETYDPLEIPYLYAEAIVQIVEMQHELRELRSKLEIKSK